LAEDDTAEVVLVAINDKFEMVAPADIEHEDVLYIEEINKKIVLDNSTGIANDGVRFGPPYLKKKAKFLEVENPYHARPSTA
jgi:hypothetical protein